MTAENKRRQILAKLEAAADLNAAEVALVELGQAIGMAMLAWAPDVACPVFDARVDAFMRAQGWPDDVLSQWWDRSVMLKSPLYIRCRFTALPFVVGLEDAGDDIAPEPRKVLTSMLEHGLTTLLTVPIHLPRSQVALITFCGNGSVEDARAVLAETKVDLMAAAQFFMAAYNKELGLGGLTEEALSKLTPKEWECLRLTAQGHREIEVARILGVEASTIRYHLRNVVTKLGASTRTHAVALAAQLGMVGPISA